MDGTKGESALEAEEFIENLRLTSPHKDHPLGRTPFHRGR